jgi:2-methylfumaryl-CoA hydratase
VTQALTLPADPRPAGGYFFEDYAVGRRFHHVTPRTLTDGDASLYIALTGARQPTHCCLPLARALGYRACPIDDFLLFNVAFGKTVPDISYNAIANLGYADTRFLEPVYAGDTITCESIVLGVKENSNGKSGVVYVRSRALNQDGTEVLTWVRWVMIAMRKARNDGGAHASEVPGLPKAVEPSRLSVPKFLRPAALESRFTGSAMLWEDYTQGDVIDHPGGMTLEESEHMLATRLYQNTARIHFDALAARDNPFGKRLVYGGHVISVCRALSYDGLENAFAVTAIHAGSHANPTFAGDTLRCRHIVLGRDTIPGRDDIGALRLRMIGAKNVSLTQLAEPGEKDPAVVLDLDYSVLIPRQQSA